MSIQHVEEGDLHEKVGRSSTPEEIIAETDDVVKYNNMVSNINESEVVQYASIDEQQVAFDTPANEEPVINNDEFEFVDKPSFVTLISCSSTKPIFVKIKKKGISKECLVTFQGMLYLMVLCFYGKIPTKGQINENKQKPVQNYRKRCVCNPRQNI